MADDKRKQTDELKVKEIERRNAVEERKRLIWEAELERKEAMLRRNNERDSKLEVAKRAVQRNASSFVFGSSTPRTINLDSPLLGPTKQNANILFPVSSRAAPTEDNAANDYSRRRPVSAYYADENSHDNMSQSLVSTHGQPIMNYRKRHTDLTPALPREREMTSSTSRINTSSSRSGINEVIRTPAPKRAVSMTRLDQLAKPRRRYLEESLKSLNSDSRGNIVSPTRPVSSLSGSAEINKEGVKMRTKPTVPRKPRPVSIGSFSSERKADNKEGEVSARGSRSTERKTHESVPKVCTPMQPTPPLRSSRARSAGASPRQLSLASPDVESKTIANATPKPPPPRKPAHVKAAAMARKTGKQSEVAANDHKSESEPQKANNDSINANDVKAESVPSVNQNESETISTLESDNGMSSEEKKKKEISGEEYKKMLAEKRKQAREMAEREAELEKERLEQQRQQELERQRKEEEEQRRVEEEQLKLLEEQKRLEEERLKRAIEEAKIKEEEENRRREEELRARTEREEKERKAREESEKQRQELEERLKRDEEERLARKKKLEAIMSRTRKTPNAKESTSPSNSPNETPEPLISNSNGNSPQKSREEEKNMQNILMNEKKEDSLIITNQSKPDLVEDVSRARQNQINGSHSNNNNHIESPESSLDSAVGNLLDFSAVNEQSNESVDSSLEQLINLNYSAPINSLPTDNNGLNANRMSNPFIAASGDMKSQEQTISDLLS